MTESPRNFVDSLGRSTFRLMSLVLLAMSLASCSEPAETSEVHVETESATAEGAHATSPYAGEETREIKSLSPSRIEQLRAGRGMGVARVAELNGLPGPMHVLELSEPLELTPEQIEATQEIFAIMNARAKNLGNELIETERRLDALFSSPTEVDSSMVKEALAQASELEGKIRWTHIRAHLAQTEVLSEAQRVSYVELRGYRGDHGQEHRHTPDRKHGMHQPPQSDDGGDE